MRSGTRAYHDPPSPRDAPLSSLKTGNTNARPTVLSPRAVAPPDLVVIQNARLFDPALGLDEVGDVVIEKGQLSRVGKSAAGEAAGSERARRIDGQGRWVLPAFVDLHAHLREPGYEYKEDVFSGLDAAAAGGFAHVCVMPNTKPVNDTRAVTELMLARAAEHGGTRLHPIAAITRGLGGKELTEMAELRRSGAVGVSDDGVCVMSSAVMRRALEYARNFDMPVIQHCEDHELTRGADMHEGAVSAELGLRGWPRVAEDVIVARDLLLAEYVGARYHVAHVSTAGAIRLLREAKSRGLPVTAEVTPHHLLLTDSAVIGYRTACKVNPPLREQADVDALRQALADGTIDAIATDHAPHSSLEKDCEFSEASPGMMGLELCFGLLLGLVDEGRVSLWRLVDALSRAPARVAGIDAPTLRAGSAADLVLVDPAAIWQPRSAPLKTKSRNTPFLDSELKGRVLMTFARGDLAFDGLPPT
jgi:dihydroorotase